MAVAVQNARLKRLAHPSKISKALLKMSRPNSAWIFKAASIITAGYPCSPVALPGTQEATGEGNEMNKFVTILGLAVIPLLSPLVGKAQSVTVFRPSPFKIDKLSAGTDGDTTRVYGEITNNAKKAASTVYILVRWVRQSQESYRSLHYKRLLTLHRGRLFHFAPPPRNTQIFGMTLL